MPKQDFFQLFPPTDVEIVSWHVVMGLGQVVTLKVLAAKLRDVNVTLEKSAWGAFRTEFHPTCDSYLTASGQPRIHTGFSLSPGHGPGCRPSWTVKARGRAARKGRWRC